MSFGAAAEANTVNEILFNLAVDAGTLNQSTTYRFRDADWGIVMEEDGAGGLVAKDPASGFAVGDVILGSFQMDFVRTTVGATNYTEFFGQGGNNHLFGRYAIEIKSVVGTTVEFGVANSAGVDPFGTGDDTMFEFWESATNPFAGAGNVPDDSTLAGWNSVGVAGQDLWASAGFDHVDDSWEFDVSPAAVTQGYTTIQEWYDAPGGQLLALGGDQIMSWIIGPDQGLNGGAVGGFAPRWLTLTSFNIGGSGTANDGVFGSDGVVYADMTIIPLPAAAWGGMVLLGMLGAGRTFRRKFIEQV
ncbi:MAG: hypothetical protein WD009_04010 [Phycisphaeraceae bacterium]